MKIIYFTSFFTTDSDFPLIKEYQKRNVDVVYCLMATRYEKCAGLINLTEKLKTGIYKASQLQSFYAYKNYIDLEKVFVFYNDSKHRRDLKSLLFHIKVYRFLNSQKADIIHFGWYQRFFGKIFYHLPLKKFLTVHDPLEHSGNGNLSIEKDRRKAFSIMDRLILLNKYQINEFSKFYEIPLDKIVVNKIGYYDYLKQLVAENRTKRYRNILFFGYIREYKGLEYLCKAMIHVHAKYPDVKLVIAGGGNVYFDWKPYENLSYIEFKNYFIDLPELAELLNDCYFSVCPYKDATQSGVVQTAFSMDVPMIVTNVGALPEVVQNEYNGLVVPPCDSISLASAICDLLEHPDKLSFMKDNIKNVWQVKMSWEQIADVNLSSYQSLL